MKYSITIFFLVVFISANGQTKKETQEWLKEKIESFSYQININEGYENRRYSVNFNDCIMIIRQEMEFSNGKHDIKLISVVEIPIKELAKPRFDERNNRIVLILRTNKDNKISDKLTSYDNNNKTYKVIKNENSSETTLVFNKNAKKEKLPERIIKAFNNLIGLCGGSVTKEVF